VQGLAFFLGVGFTLLGIAYTAVVLFVRGAIFGTDRQPYLQNGIALTLLGVSLLARAFSVPNGVVYALWAVAAFLAIRANRQIMASRHR